MAKPSRVGDGGCAPLGETLRVLFPNAGPSFVNLTVGTVSMQPCCAVAVENEWTNVWPFLVPVRDRICWAG